MLLHDLLGDVNVLELIGDPRVDITALTHDSRCVEPGACFCCIPGERTDGHDHAAAAADAGARALLVERILPVAIAQARVARVRDALGLVADRFLGSPSRSLSCLGVTGTNGKTTTTYLLEAIARTAGERTGVIGTLGARIDREVVAGERTTPEATELQGLLARMRDARVRAVAMEVSSHALAQGRVNGVWFAVACFTNLTQDHLDYHLTLDAYFEAKASLFHPARIGAAALNVDDPYGRILVERVHAEGLALRTFALHDHDADLGAENVELGERGTRFALVDRRTGRAVPVALQLVGQFNITNALAAAATALLAGFDLDVIAQGLGKVDAVPGRVERIDAGQDFTVLVDYAHTPDALGRLLAAARALAPHGRVVAVFGCGGDRDRDKRPLMGSVVANAADLVYLTSDNPRSEDPSAIASQVELGLRESGATYIVELDRRAAIHGAIVDARPGDVVVIAGKGHEVGQTVNGVTRPFDDRVVAREELEMRACV